MLPRILLLGFFLLQSPQEQRIGPAAFRIFKRGDAIILAPVITPEFKVMLMEGPKPVVDEVQQCIVYAHYLSEEDKTRVVTVIKCGESVYGLTEVDFVMNEKK